MLKNDKPNILLTGANGYIGMRLLPLLVDRGYFVYCCVRSKDRFDFKPSFEGNIELVIVDFLKPEESEPLPKDVDIAYYLIHSMTAGSNDFDELESQAARNFVKMAEKVDLKQVIYLTGIVNDEHLSKHLQSRKNVEEILFNSDLPCTVLRAGIIVGSGSASFEIMRDLIEKLPFMITPRWLNTKSHPIAIRNVCDFLVGVMGREDCLNEAFDIAGPEVLTYKQMLLQFAEVRNLKRVIVTLPVMTPRLSSYWLYFVTATSYPLAVNLVNSMKVSVVARDYKLKEMLGIRLIPYKEAVKLAFNKIEQNMILSSWKDSLVTSTRLSNLSEFVEIPKHGVFRDIKKLKLKPGSEERVKENIFSIGGNRGWYYASWLWGIRGFLDKLAGGVGLRRGRRSQSELVSGDALDFWRVLVADREEGRLLLLAEMKLPGEAWLEFNMFQKNGKSYLKQTATFRPSGVLGRVYWWLVFPFHIFVFNGMINKIVRHKNP
ncbi:SDR family oxidoreductase [Halocola ammonii]